MTCKRLREALLMWLRECGCEVMWRRMEYKKRWKGQNCFSFVGKNAPLLQVMVLGPYHSPKLSRYLEWKCNLLSDCFQPISHFLFPSFTLLVHPQLCGTLDQPAGKENSCKTWECECLLSVGDTEFLWLPKNVFKQLLF